MIAIAEYFWLSFSGRSVSVNIPKAQASPQNKPSGDMESVRMSPWVDIKNTPPTARKMDSNSSLFGNLFFVTTNNSLWLVNNIYRKSITPATKRRIGK